MKDLKLFLDLVRIKKPIGIMLLFWPCSWGLSLVYDFGNNYSQFALYLIYFFLGSMLMRSAGCIVNDILDRKFDILVKRTKNRPIASGKISVNLSLLYVIILCSLSFLILIQFNFTTILLGLASMPFAFSYPLMKRFTYWPQLFLGFTFNYGLIMAWFSINPEFNYIPLVFYCGAIFWTLAYDTIYGFQDIKDDEIIGLKSTSIKFKSNPRIFLNLCYLIFFISIILIGILMKLNNYYFLFSIFIFFQLFYLQLKKLDVESPLNCLKTFKSNNFLGFVVFVNLLIGKI